MTYSVRHITNFHYQPAVREVVMEVRVQPRNEARQRCLSFSLDVTPRANVMLYRDFLGNTVHHFDIPGQHEQIHVSAHALVEVTASPVPQPQDVQDWEKLDASIASGDFWEMLLPSQYTQPTLLLEELASEVRAERRGNPLELLLELNEALYRTFAYVPNSTKVDSPIDDALRARQGVCQDFAHIAYNDRAGETPEDSLPVRERLSVSRGRVEQPFVRGCDARLVSPGQDSSVVAQDCAR
jgi:transglutaminase-like putative cysteine protease